MKNTEIQHVLKVKSLIENKLNDLLEKCIMGVNMIEIGEYLLEQQFLPDDYILTDIIKCYLNNLEYIETYTSIESLIPDELFDKLLEKYKDLTICDTNINTSIKSASGKNLLEHQYPELRGTLDKVHFIKSIDICKNDNRKSLEMWLNNTERLCNNINGVEYRADFKYDGLSVVLECEGNFLILH